MTGGRPSWFQRLLGKRQTPPDQPPPPQLSIADLTPAQARLYESAAAIVEKYVMSGKAMPHFATVLQTDGEIHSFLASDEFSNLSQATAGLINALLEQIWASRITAAVMVTPMDATPGFDGEAVVFDLEEKGAPRINVVLPYWTAPAEPRLGETTFLPAPPKLFVTPRPNSR